MSIQKFFINDNQLCILDCTYSSSPPFITKESHFSEEGCLIERCEYYFFVMQFFYNFHPSGFDDEHLFTDFTFAVWNGNQLVPFTKAYSGLTDAEFRDITAWVRRNTQQRFGPVRQVTPELVFEIAFEGIHESTRHKSGIALRFPRMARWRRDKPVQEANTLEDLQEMLRTFG